MKTGFYAILSLTLFLAACNPLFYTSSILSTRKAVKPEPIEPVTIKLDSLKIKDIDLNLDFSAEGFMICSKPKDIPEWPEDQAPLHTKVTLKKYVQDTVVENCDGKSSIVEDAEKTTYVEQIVLDSIDIPEDDDIAYFSVYNHDSCSIDYSTSILDASFDTSQFGKKRIRSEWSMHKFGSFIDSEGKFMFHVQNRKVFFPNIISMVEGRNRIEITFFKECKEYSSKKAEKDELFQHCTEPEVIGSQFVDVFAKFDTNKIPGYSRDKETCSEDEE